MSAHEVRALRADAQRNRARLLDVAVHAFHDDGPDVTTGAVAGLAGHVNTLPAEDCYLHMMGGPADGSGAVLTFDAASCYGP